MYLFVFSKKNKVYMYIFVQQVNIKYCISILWKLNQFVFVAITIGTEDNGKSKCYICHHNSGQGWDFQRGHLSQWQLYKMGFPSVCRDFLSLLVTSPEKETKRNLSNRTHIQGKTIIIFKPYLLYPKRKNGLWLCICFKIEVTK